jgi:toxin ParE1/3/4
VSRVTLRPEATSDLESIEEYIAQDDVDQALAFIERLFDTMSLLGSQPEMGRARPELGPALRSFPVGQYVVFYEPAPGGIDVVRVLSGARDVDALF